MLQEPDNTAAIRARPIGHTVLLGVAGFIVGLFGCPNMNHRCVFGVKWFENLLPFVIALLAVWIVIRSQTVPRGFLLLIALLAILHVWLVPWYMDVVHAW